MHLGKTITIHKQSWESIVLVITATCYISFYISCELILSFFLLNNRNDVKNHIESVVNNYLRLNEFYTKN